MKFYGSIQNKEDLINKGYVDNIVYSDENKNTGFGNIDSLEFYASNGFGAGTNNIIGSKAFNILNMDATNHTFTLDSVEGLEVGDIFTIKFNTNYNDMAKITAINENIITTSALSKEELSNLPNPNGRTFDDIWTDSLVLENGEVVFGTEVNSLRVNTKPQCGTKFFGTDSFVEGCGNIATGDCAHAEGVFNQAVGRYAHVEGLGTIAYYSAHSEGKDTKAIGDMAHAEGQNSKAVNLASHAEGSDTLSSGEQAHAEGWKSKATGPRAHAEGQKTEATELGAHAEGDGTVAGNKAAHAEGYNTQALGGFSHAEGWGTIANAGVNAQHVQGRWNKSLASPYVHIVGHGTSDTNRKNIHTLDWNGNGRFLGDVYTGGTESGQGKKLATEEFVSKEVAAMVDSAPETLNTLNELANALGNDENFATTVTNQIAKKINKYGNEETVSLIGITTSNYSPSEGSVISEKGVNAGSDTFTININNTYVRISGAIEGEGVNISVDNKLIKYTDNYETANFFYEGYVQNSINIQCFMGSAYFEEFKKFKSYEDSINMSEARLSTIEEQLQQPEALASYSQDLVPIKLTDYSYSTSNEDSFVSQQAIDLYYGGDATIFYKGYLKFEATCFTDDYSNVSFYVDDQSLCLYYNHYLEDNKHTIVYEGYVNNYISVSCLSFCANINFTTLLGRTYQNGIITGEDQEKIDLFITPASYKAQSFSGSLIGITNLMDYTEAYPKVTENTIENKSSYDCCFYIDWPGFMNFTIKEENTSATNEYGYASIFIDDDTLLEATSVPDETQYYNEYSYKGYATEGIYITLGANTKLTFTSLKGSRYKYLNGLITGQQAQKLNNTYSKKEVDIKINSLIPRAIIKNNALTINGVINDVSINNNILVIS